VAAATGLSALLAGSIFLYEALRWAGVLFMLYLAVEAFRDDGSAAPVLADKLAGFRRGLIANILNPKALVFYLVVVGQFANPVNGHLWVQIIALGAIHIFVSLMVHVSIVMLGDGMGSLFEKWRKSFWVRLGFALALALIALWIAATTARV